MERVIGESTIRNKIVYLLIKLIMFIFTKKIMAKYSTNRQSGSPSFGVCPHPFAVNSLLRMRQSERIFDSTAGTWTDEDTRPRWGQTNSWQ